jgi:hypothetical protein
MKTQREKRYKIKFKKMGGTPLPWLLHFAPSLPESSTPLERNESGGSILDA